MAVKRLGSGRNLAIKTEVVGIKELNKRVSQFVSAMSDPERAAAKETVAAGIADAAVYVRDQMRAKQRAAGWPKRLEAAAFAFTDLQKSQRGRLTALAGVRTGAPPRLDQRIYMEWSPRSGNTSKRAAKAKDRRQAAGHNPTKIGMSLAAMYEYGTSKMRARPAIRSVIYGSSTVTALQKVRESLEAVVARYGRAA